MLGPGTALAALAILIVVASAVFHHRLRLADEAGRRIAALPYVLFAAAVVALFAIGTVLTFWTTRASGSGGIGSVSAGLSEALVETMLVAVVVVTAVVVISTFGRRPR